VKDVDHDAEHSAPLPVQHLPNDVPHSASRHGRNVGRADFTRRDVVPHQTYLKRFDATMRVPTHQATSHQDGGRKGDVCPILLEEMSERGLDVCLNFRARSAEVRLHVREGVVANVSSSDCFPFSVQLDVHGAIGTVDHAEIEETVDGGRFVLMW
jgi:hypothetical protein